MVAIRKREIPAAFRLVSDDGLIMRAIEEECIQETARLSDYDLSKANMMVVCSSFMEAKRYPHLGRTVRDHIIWWAILRILYWKYGETLIPDDLYRTLDKHLFQTINATWETDPPMRELYWFGVGRSIREDGWEPNLNNYPGKYFWPPCVATNTRSHWMEPRAPRLRRLKSKK